MKNITKNIISKTNQAANKHTKNAYVLHFCQNYKKNQYNIINLSVKWRRIFFSFSSIFLCFVLRDNKLAIESIFEKEKRNEKKTGSNIVELTKRIQYSECKNVFFCCCCFFFMLHQFINGLRHFLLLLDLDFFFDFGFQKGKIKKNLNFFYIVQLVLVKLVLLLLLCFSFS